MDTNYDPSEEFLGGINQRSIPDDSFIEDEKPILMPNPETGYSEVVYDPVNSNKICRIPPAFNSQGQFANNSAGSYLFTNAGFKVVPLEFDGICDSGVTLTADSEPLNSGNDASANVDYSDIAADLDISDSDDDEDMIEVPPAPEPHFMF